MTDPEDSPAAGSGRPGLVVLMAGTGTSVGKTWVGAGLLAELRRRGVAVAARKPVQSADPDDGPADSVALARASGERPDEVCGPGRSFEVPMTPFMAAEVLGRPLEPLADLVESIRWPERVDVGLVESVGGVRTPITADGGDTVTIAALLRPDVTVLVADAGLGTLNLVQLSLAALPGPTVVYLNRYDPAVDLHRRNLAWLRSTVAATVLTTVSELADHLVPDPA